MRRLFLLLLVISCLFPIITQANTGRSSTHSKNKLKTFIQPPATITQKEETTDFKITGYIEGSYNYLSRNKFTSGYFDRVFDLVPNGTTLHQADMMLAYQPKEGVGSVLDLLMGSDANITAPYGFIPSSEFNSQTVAVDFPQAYLQYVTGPFTLIVGRFISLASYETIDPTQNMNFSQGIISYAAPNTHTGVRGIYTINDKINLTAGVNDGWDTIRDWQRRKTIELGFSDTVNSFFSYTLLMLNGQERVVPFTDVGPLGILTLFDFAAILHATEKLTFVANYDYGWQTKAELPNETLNKATWQGIAGYINYKLKDNWYAAIRGELFADSNGYRTGVRQNWREITLTLGYEPIKNLEIRMETRHDFSNVDSFTSNNGMTSHPNNQSYAVEAFYKFG